ncbi:RING-type E3 ubiquitin transferase [Sarracenia purpurea var. burkii]
MVGNPSSDDGLSNFQPSLAVVIGILAVMFSLTFVLLVYAKLCHRTSSSPLHNDEQQSLDGLIRSGSRFSGIDKTVIESLPFFRFSSLRGSREGLECSVCLSRFEDIEILRLLPKCKHAFHINCVDQWLEKHSSCPLCRRKVSADDLALMTLSNSLRFLSNQSESRGPGDSNVELFVQREEDHRSGSSRFSIGSSLRRVDRGKKEDELPIKENSCDFDDDQNLLLHKFNHKIIVSDSIVLLQNRWSNLSSSDLMFLNSQMIGSMSSNRFASLDSNKEQSSNRRGIDSIEDGRRIMKIKEEMERKRDFENRIIGKMNQNGSLPLSGSSSISTASDSKPIPRYESRVLNQTDKRSMSEITVHPRFREPMMMKNSVRESSLPENAAKEERLKRVWLPIARRTVQWFANREERSQQSQNTRQELNV